jgi:cell division protein FtsQ
MNTRNRFVAVARRLIRSPSALATIVVAAVFAYGFVWLAEALRTSDRFALDTLRVEGNQRVSDEALARLSGLELGTNLFALDLSAARRQLAAHPMVRKARAYRVLPSSVVVQVEEHVPFGLVSLGQTYLATRDGLFIRAVEAGDALDVPLVTGLRRDDVEDARSERLREAFELLQAWRERELPAVQEIHLADGSTVVRSRLGWSADLGPRPAERLPRLQRILARATREGRELSHIRFGKGKRATVALGGDDDET